MRWQSVLDDRAGKTEATLAKLRFGTGCNIGLPGVTSRQYRWIEDGSAEC